MALLTQILTVFALAIPVACVTWTVTHEHIFLETQKFCRLKSEKARSLLERKFFYLFTCEYCFSHYVAAAFLILSSFKFLLPDWRGYVTSEFALVFIANFYMTVFGILRQKLKSDRIEANFEDEEWQNFKRGGEN